MTIPETPACGTNEAEEKDLQTPPPPQKKRNSGRTGPTSSAGRLRSSRNSFKHGCCAHHTLILSNESEKAWNLLLARWCTRYKVAESDNSLEYDFVLRAAQAEWHRLRCQRNYDVYIATTMGSRSPHSWEPEQLKNHDLYLRYKNTAERTYHRENRACQQHFKFVQQQEQQQARLVAAAAEAAKAKQTADSDDDLDDDPDGDSISNTESSFTVLAVDAESPTGISVVSEIINNREVRNPRPFVPPVPIPDDWPKQLLLPKKGDPGSA